MGSFFILQAFFTMMLSGFAGGDILDFMTTDGYWKAKNMTVTVEQLKELAKAPPEVGDISKLVQDLGAAEFKVRDAAREKIEALGVAALPELKKAQKIKNEEAAETVRGMIEKLKGHERARSIERLMAIRTLGEKKEKSAIAVLEEDLKSKEMFVADYAERALALIQGKPLPERQSKKLDGDPWLMPDDVSMLVQVRPWAKGTQPTIESMAEISQSRVRAGDLDAESKGERTAQAYATLLEIVERVGNIRCDGITVQASSKAGPGTGWLAIIVRATYDRDAVVDAFKTQADQVVKVTTDGDFPVIKMRGDAHLLLPTQDMGILVTGPGATQTQEAVDAFTEALKTGKGKIAGSALQEKIKDLQKSGGPAWGLAVPSPQTLNIAPWLKNFSELKLTTAVDEKQKLTTFSVACDGTDADEVKKSADDMQEYIKKMKQSLGDMKNDARAPKALVDLVNSVQVEVDGLKLKVNGTLPENMGELGSVMLWGAAF